MRSFCKHGYTGWCEICARNRLLVGVANALLITACAAVLAYACVAEAATDCRWISVGAGPGAAGERFWVCGLEAPEPPATRPWWVAPLQPVAPFELPPRQHEVIHGPPGCITIDGHAYCAPPPKPPQDRRSPAGG